MSSESLPVANPEPYADDALYFDLPEDAYFGSNRVSKHDLDHIDVTPAHYQSYKERGHKDTAALAFGKAFHKSILEPALFAEIYAVKPKFDKRTTSGKLQSAEWDKENDGKTAIEIGDFCDVKEMAQAVREHTAASEMLTHHQREVSVFATNLGVKVRSRVDVLAPGAAYDLKSCTSADFHSFSLDMHNYRYHVQAAFYLDNIRSLGIACDSFRFVAVEKTAPYAVAVYEIDEDSLELGREAYTRNLLLYKQCVQWGHWPAFSNKVQPIRLPKWAFNK